MFRLSPRSDVQVSVVPQHSGRLHWSTLVVAGELLDGVEGFLVHQKSLLDPTLQTARRADARETLLAIDDFDALPVFYHADTVVNSRDLIAQRSLWRRDVSDFEYAVASPPAACE